MSSERGTQGHREDAGTARAAEELPGLGVALPRVAALIAKADRDIDENEGGLVVVGRERGDIGEQGAGRFAACERNGEPAVGTAVDAYGQAVDVAALEATGEAAHERGRLG